MMKKMDILKINKLTTIQLNKTAHRPHKWKFGYLQNIKYRSFTSTNVKYIDFSNIDRLLEIHKDIIKSIQQDIEERKKKTLDDYTNGRLELRKKTDNSVLEYSTSMRQYLVLFKPENIDNYSKIISNFYKMNILYNDKIEEVNNSETGEIEKYHNKNKLLFLLDKNRQIFYSALNNVYQKGIDDLPKEKKEEVKVIHKDG